MGVGGERAGGLGRPLRDVLASAGAGSGPRAGRTPHFPVDAPPEALDGLQEDVLTLLCATFPGRLCASVRQPPDDVAVARLRGAAVADEEAAFRLLDGLRTLSDQDGVFRIIGGQPALVTSIPTREGELILAVWQAEEPFSEHDETLIRTIQRLLATSTTIVLP
jgi:hypothetical protein